MMWLDKIGHVGRVQHRLTWSIWNKWYFELRLKNESEYDDRSRMTNPQSFVSTSWCFENDLIPKGPSAAFKDKATKHRLFGSFPQNLVHWIMLDAPHPPFLLKPRYIQLYVFVCVPGGGGGFSIKFYTERLRPYVEPLTLLYVFAKKGNSFV